MKIRPKFTCWNCERTYTLLRETEEQPKLIVECPFCGAEAEVDLAPWRTPTMNIQKGSGANEQALGETLNLPDVLPTTPRQTT